MIFPLEKKLEMRYLSIVLLAKLIDLFFYLSRTVVIQIFVVLIGLSIPLTKGMIPIWILYAILSGTTSMGLWVLAHECGHGAFSDNRKLETVVGYCLHSFFISSILFVAKIACCSPCFYQSHNGWRDPCSCCDLRGW